MNVIDTCKVIALASAMLNVADATADGPAPDADTEYMGALVFAAKQRHDWLPDFYRINPTLDDAELYAIQDSYVRHQLAGGDRISGYKAGFVPRAPVGGVLLTGGVLQPDTPIRVQDFRLLVIEAELAFRFCAAVTAPLGTVAALREVVCEVAPAFEIADGALADFAAVKQDFTHLRAALIPLNVAYDKVMVGAPKPAADIDVASLGVTTRHDGESIGARTPGPDLWASVLWAVDHFVLARGYSIDAGQFIIPGNLTGIHVGQAGRYEADFGALGTLSLEVRP